MKAILVSTLNGEVPHDGDEIAEVRERIADKTGQLLAHVIFRPTMPKRYEIRTPTPDYPNDNHPLADVLIDCANFESDIVGIVEKYYSQDFGTNL